MTNPIKIKRQALGLTKTKLAEKANIPFKTYIRYEADLTDSNYRTPNVLSAIKIADVLGVKDLHELWKTKTTN